MKTPKNREKSGKKTTRHALKKSTFGLGASSQNGYTIQTISQLNKKNYLCYLNTQ
jgi:hypothetical protein